MAVPRVGIVVLNYNGAHCLLACLRSLQRLEYPEKDVVVVDNASEDHSLQRAREAYPEYTYLQNGSNLGFAAGMNVGIRAALERGAAYVWLMNNDAQVEPLCLSRLVSVAQKNPVLGLLSPFILTPQKKLWFGKGRIDWLRMRATHVWPSSEEREADYFESPFLTGCALLIREGALQALGGLDEDFFLYYEDVDISLRARGEGFSLGVVPSARVLHSEQSTESSEKTYHLVLSGLIFFDKHARGLQKKYQSVYFFLRRLKNRIDLWLKRPQAPAVARAYAVFLRR